jgi:hypothetical protein
MAYDSESLVTDMSEISDDLDVARKTAEEGYCDCFGSLANCAQELTEETTTIPQALRNYIDYESMARDIELTGYLFTVEVAPGGSTFSGIGGPRLSRARSLPAGDSSRRQSIHTATSLRSAYLELTQSAKCLAVLTKCPSK